MGRSGRGDPAFRVTEEDSNPPAEVSPFSGKFTKNVYYLRVFTKSSARKQMKKKMAVDFFRGHGLPTPDSSPPRKSLATPLVHRYGDVRYGALNKFV